MIRFTTVFIAFFFYFTVFSQSTFYFMSTVSVSPGTDVSAFFRLDMAQCHLDTICLFPEGATELSFSYCLSPTGVFYFYKGEENAIYSFDTTTCSFSLVHILLNDASVCNPSDPSNPSDGALSVDEKGRLYILGTNGIRYNPFTGEEEIIFTFDPCNHDLCPVILGDTIWGVDSYKNLIRLNTDNNTLDTVSLNIPEDLPEFQSSVFNYTHCDSTPQLIIRDLLIDFNAFNLFVGYIDYDISNSSYDTVCTLPSLEFINPGMTCSPVSTPNACKVIINLDMDSLTASGGNFVFQHGCGPGPIVAPVCEQNITADINILPTLDSVIIRIQSGIVDIGNEYLTIPTFLPFITATGDGTNTIVLRNTGGASADAFEDAIRQVRYHHTGTTPSPGNRMIEVSPYRFHLKGVTTTATIQINGTYPSSYIQTISGCPGLSVTVGPNTYTTSGTYLDTLQNYQGCDSLITTTIFIYAPQQTTQVLTLCNGDSVQVGNHIYHTSGTYTDLLTNTYGCDSVVTTQLNILPASTHFIPIQICDGEAYNWNGQVFTTPITITDTLLTSNNCDSIITLDLTVLPLQSFIADTILCPGATLQWEGIQINTPGSYSVQKINNTGCLDSFILSVDYSPLFLTMPEDMASPEGTEILLSPQTIAPDMLSSISWSPAEGLSCANCLSPVAVPAQSGIYALTLHDIYNCQVEGSVEITIHKNDHNVYIPNIFSPYNELDQNNTRFNVYTDETVQSIVLMQIYDRWGALIFERKATPPNSEDGWDGFVNGKKAESGVYTYLIILEFSNGKQQYFKGTITVI